MDVLLNPDKTEFIIFSSKRQRDKLKACFAIDILGSPLCPVNSVKNLGVWSISDFSLSMHAQDVCKSCFVKLRDFRQVRWFLTHDVSVLVADALVSSRLDYCNSLFRSLSKFNLRKLQCIQNSAARIVSNNSQYTSITSVLKKLQWLPFEQRTVLRQPHLFTSFFTQVFLGILLHIFLLIAVLIVQGAAKIVAISLPFQSSTLLSINLSNSLVIVLLLMLLLFGMLFQMRFGASPSLASFRKQLKTSVHQSIPALAWIVPRCSLWCLTPLLSLDTEI